MTSQGFGDITNDFESDTTRFYKLYTVIIIVAIVEHQNTNEYEVNICNPYLTEILQNELINALIQEIINHCSIYINNINNINKFYYFIKDLTFLFRVSIPPPKPTTTYNNK